MGQNTCELEVANLHKPFSIVFAQGKDRPSFLEQVLKWQPQMKTIVTLRNGRKSLPMHIKQTREQIGTNLRTLELKDTQKQGKATSFKKVMEC